MRVREGDVIGTKDNRYGEIIFLVTQRWFLVAIYDDVDNDVGSYTPPQEWMSIENVASIR